MIKRWSTFNENSSDDLRSQLASKLTEVRDVLTEFEDMGIITYTVIASGFERGGYSSFDPKRGDFERFLDHIVPTVKFGLGTTQHTQRGERSKVKSLHTGNNYEVSEKDFCIITDIKIPGESNEFGSTVINSEGIKIFEDILVANSRLIDMGYDVKLDLNASHSSYKPAKFLIYFNI